MTDLQGPDLDRPAADASDARALLAELARLDRRLDAAVAAMQAAHGPEAAADPYRGLYVSHDEAATLAGRGAGAPAAYALASEDAESDAADGSRWARLKRAAGLDALDAAILL